MRIRNVLFFGSSLVLGAAMATASGCGINSTSTAGFDTEGQGGSRAGSGGVAASGGGVTKGGAAGIASGSGGVGGTAEGKPCETVADCDDGNPCTSESCVAKHCASSPALPNSECDTDDDRCNGVGTCDGTVCKPKPGSAPNMDDGDPCTVPSCDPATGSVTHLAKVKETDNTACSKAVCDPVTGAVTTEDVDVDDGDACTVDACDLSAGPVHTPVQLGDKDPCTVDKCDKVAGVTHEPIKDCLGCGSAETPEEADASCDDGDPCTRDFCAPAAKASDRKCAKEIVEDGTNIDDDGTVCNGIDTCQGGKRVAGTSIDVDDNNKCTDDKCDDKTGEVSHTPIGVDDGNKCTIDSCDPQGGALHTPVNADDGDGCTTNDRCDPNGKGDGLTSDPIPNCTSCKVTNDCTKLNKTCQTFQCDSNGQCKPVNLTSDGACSSQTTTCKSFGCSAGSCVGKNATNGTSCDNDTNKCNGDCVCSSGSPSTSPAKNPDDSKACTTDTCDPATGNPSNTPKPGCQPCTATGQCTNPPSGTDASCINQLCTKGSNTEGECTYSFKSSGTVCGAPSACTLAATCDGAGHCGGGTTVADCCLTSLECNVGNTDPLCKPKVCNQTTHKCEEQPVVCAKTCGKTAGGGPGEQAQTCKSADGSCQPSGGLSGCNPGQICLEGTGCSNCTGNASACPDTQKCDNTGLCCAETCAANQDCENAKPGCDVCTCGTGTTCKPNGAGNPKTCKP
jgi:hypothetical protein